MILMIIYRVGCVYHYISFSIDLLAYDSIYLSICVPTFVIDDVSIQKLLSRDIKDTSMFTDSHEVPINGLKNGMFLGNSLPNWWVSLLLPNGRKKSD